MIPNYPAEKPSVEGAKDLIRAEISDLGAGIFDVITIPLLSLLFKSGSKII